MEERLVKITDDIYLRFIDMPPGIKAFTIKDPDGNFNIYINERLSDEMRFLAYKHEIEHILRNDWQSPLPVWFIEELVRRSNAS